MLTIDLCIVYHLAETNSVLQHVQKYNLSTLVNNTIIAVLVLLLVVMIVILVGVVVLVVIVVMMMMAIIIIKIIHCLQRSDGLCHQMRIRV